MMRRGPLLHHLKRIIESTYDLDTGIEDIGPYLIGDEGYARFYAGRPIVQKVAGAALPATARTLLRSEEGALRICIYYPDRLVENLERHDPSRGLGDENVDDFATLIEELDHFLVIADRHRAGGATSMLELELHANVTKALALGLFVVKIRGTRRLAAEDRAWVRHHLFGKCDYVEEDPDVRARYRDAAALAVRYLDHLERLPAPSRPSELRRFHRRTHQQKIAQISRL